VIPPLLFRERHRAHPWRILAGVALVSLWFLALVPLGLAPWPLAAVVVASIAAWCAVAGLLMRHGDRGVAAGVGLAAGLALALLVRFAVRYWVGW
jgi:hypothetical protein